MTKPQLIPALDLQNGRCVRLLHGRADDVTVYGRDPLAQARAFAAQGAKWLHMVDLDGAFHGGPRNGEIIAAVCCGAGLNVEVGGGIRSAEIARAYLAVGAARVVLGTWAVEAPEKAAALAREQPGRIALALDARGGPEAPVATGGWANEAAPTLRDSIAQLADVPFACCIYTDITRDGSLVGPNLDGIAALAALSPWPLIASGGVGALEHLRALARLPIAGVIVGKALYEGRFTLAQAKQALDEA